MGCSASSDATEANGPTQFAVIRDRFESVDEVQSDLRARGLESSDVCVYVDYTKSNDWSGAKTFHGRSLHDLQTGANPYQQVISIICTTLAAFDDDKLIPTYGFGDIGTRGKALFSFQPNNQPVHTFDGILALYAQITPHVALSGPTSFAPAILSAIDTVIRNDGAYHIALIIADGQVSEHCMRDTIDAIVLASHYPLSIVIIGVGDGPFDAMENFDDGLPARRFDNLQFVDFSRIMVECARGGFSPQKAEAAFALAALMEIPDQYAAIKKLGLLGTRSLPPAPPAPVAIHNPPMPH